jgi:hypothetical protein
VPVLYTETTSSFPVRVHQKTPLQMKSKTSFMYDDLTTCCHECDVYSLPLFRTQRVNSKLTASDAVESVVVENRTPLMYYRPANGSLPYLRITHG